MTWKHENVIFQSNFFILEGGWKNIAEESKGKGNVHPGTGHEEPEGEWM
jgi:hypothetical protein